MAIQQVNPTEKKDKKNKLLIALQIGQAGAGAANSIDNLSGNRLSNFLKKKPEMGE